MSDFRTRSAAVAARFFNCKIASYGNSFTNGTGVNESMDMGLRGDAGTITIKPNPFTDAAGRPIPNHMNAVEIKFRQYENRLQDVYNAYLLSNVSGGVDVGAQFQAQDAATKWWNFTKSAGTISVPTAVGVVGFSYKFVVNQKERYIDWTGNYDITDAEYSLLTGSLQASASAGDTTGGSVLGLVAGGYSRSNNYIPGIDHIVVAGNTYGIVDETFEYSLESVADPQKDNRMRPINNKSKCTVKFGVPQTLAADFTRMITTLNADQTIVFYLLSGETITCAAGALQVNPTLVIGDKERHQMYEGGGEFVNNPVEASPTSLDWKSSATDLHMYLLGYIAQ